ncbi:MAG: cobalt-precorrin-5B (C(1))-methyltransferase [Syntrophobacteraceae bacterium]
MKELEKDPVGRVGKIPPVAETGEKRKKLRKGFSTGTAATAAAVAALRLRLTGLAPEIVAVRLPDSCYLPIPIASCGVEGPTAWAGVVKDGGDDPDVTHKALVRVSVRSFRAGAENPPFAAPGIRLVAGPGVGVVTKAGLPVGIGEPAVNPVPRGMIAENLAEELARHAAGRRWEASGALEGGLSLRPSAWVSFPPAAVGLAGVFLEVEICVPGGEELARHTLNPRLGILGGISILGTTGIVKPFSHRAYEETIQAALSVAAANGCREAILTTGGKSERFAREVLPESPPEAFVQIADFFAFAVREACRAGFERLVHAVFFGKIVKMAAGNEYTHAHEVPLDLGPLAVLAGKRGYPVSFCGEIASANTARHALELLLAAGAEDVIRDVSLLALAKSARIAGASTGLRLLLFDYDGRLLMDLRR